MVAGWFKNCQSCTKLKLYIYIYILIYLFIFIELLSAPWMLTKNRINIYYLFIIFRKLYLFQTNVLDD